MSWSGSSPVTEDSSPWQHYLVAERDRDHIDLYTLASKHMGDPALKVGDSFPYDFLLCWHFPRTSSWSSRIISSLMFSTNSMTLNCPHSPQRTETNSTSLKIALNNGIAWISTIQPMTSGGARTGWAWRTGHTSWPSRTTESTLTHTHESLQFMDLMFSTDQQCQMKSGWMYFGFTGTWLMRPTELGGRPNGCIGSSPFHHWRMVHSVFWPYWHYLQIPPHPQFHPWAQATFSQLSHKFMGLWGRVWLEDLLH